MTGFCKAHPNPVAPSCWVGCQWKFVMARPEYPLFEWEGKNGIFTIELAELDSWLWGRLKVHLITQIVSQSWAAWCLHAEKAPMPHPQNLVLRAKLPLNMEVQPFRGSWLIALIDLFPPRMLLICLQNFLSGRPSPHPVARNSLLIMCCMTEICFSWTYCQPVSHWTALISHLLYSHSPHPSDFISLYHIIPFMSEDELVDGGLWPRFPVKNYTSAMNSHRGAQGRP